MPVSGVPAWVYSEKNKLAQQGWILLFEVEYNPGVWFRIARWSQNVTWNGQTYVCFPIGDISMSQNTEGQIPTVDVPVGGVSAFIMSLMEGTALEGKKGNIYLVHSQHLADATPVRKNPFTIYECSATWNVCTFSVVLAQAAFEPFGITLPVKLVTRDDFPGVPGSAITV